MKVIAINDSPLTERAYYKGDVFEIYDGPYIMLNRRRRRTEEYLIIYHDKLKMPMDVDTRNFITLREHREIKLKELGI
jgi:hypothetical protein